MSAGASPSRAPSVRAIGIAGPTGCGKSDLALAFARQHGAVDIISVDSAQVYRGLDIGTAKPSMAERAEVPHHLIDICELHQAYSAASFALDARRLIAEINARGRLALLVGGTMLYFKALMEGLHVLPAAAPGLRAALEAQAARDGWPALHAQLATVDAPTAARLAPNDAQRIQRALEVWQTSGMPLSQWLQQPKGSGLHVPLLCLAPAARGWLHQRLAQRLEHMWARGLVQEVQALHTAGRLTGQETALRCVGYRQIWQALDRGEDGAQAQAAALAATRQLAKRQLTWLRGVSASARLACDAPDALQQGIEWLRATAEFQRHPP